MRAAAEAAAAAAAAEAAAAPLHEDNEWGIEVASTDDPTTDAPSTGAAGGANAAASSSGAAAEALPEGLQFAMPSSGVDAAVLREEAVQPTDASLDELTSMLTSLNK